MRADAPPTAFFVSPAEAGARLDRVLCGRFSGIARRAWWRLLAQGAVRVDGRCGSKGERLVVGQRVRVDLGAIDERPVAQPELPLAVVALRPDVVVLNKPSGWPCYPLAPGERGTLANALVARFPECRDASCAPREAGLVHRLDLTTSGAILAARHRDAYLRLRSDIATGGISKRYWALVSGSFPQSMTLRAHMAHVAGDPRRMTVSSLPGPQSAPPPTTRVLRLATSGALSLVQATLTVGKRHQVRVHLAHHGFPLVGDTLYGGPTMPGIAGAFLHACRLEVDGEVFCAPLPSDRRALLCQLGFSVSDG